MGTLLTEDESAGTHREKVEPTWRDPEACLPREKRRMRQNAGAHRATILLVENEQAIREMLRMYLEGAGYSVLEAGDGDEALAVWERHAQAIDLVLADWMMPGRLNGCQLVRQLQTSRPGLEAIIVSGQSSEAFEDEVMSGGPKNFLPKPYRLDCLAAMVHRCLQHAEAA